MFAQSEQIKNVGAGNVPLFSKHVPLPVTHRGTAESEIKQFQLVHIDADSKKVAPVTELGGTELYPTPSFGIAVYPAKANETVTFYVHGSINVDAIDVSAIALLKTADAKTKMAALNALGSQTLLFDVIGTDPIQRA